MTRRDFQKRMLGGLVAAAAVPLQAAKPKRTPEEAGGESAPADEPKREIVLGELPLLFADDSGLVSRVGTLRTVHPARQREAPVLEAEKPWESDRVYIYGSVYRDAATGEFRMWYLSRLQTEENIGAKNVPGFRGYNFDVDLFATSQDGLHWTRPALGLHPFDGSAENNILFDLHSPSVLFDPREKNPARRYKMLGNWHGKYYAAVSPDGLQWSRHPGDDEVLPGADNVSLTRDPFTGDYLAYHRRTFNGRRATSLSRSQDFETWSPAKHVFAPDAEDEAWRTGPGQQTEVNNLSVFPHAGGFIGLPTIFRVLGVNGPQSKLPKGQSSTDGLIDVQLITSANGENWARTTPRIPVISRGPRGHFDGGTILGVSSTYVDTPEETWVYYTGLTTSHGATIPPKRISIGRAEWRRHGWVSLDAGIQARVETKPLRLGKPALVVNASAVYGELRVALLEANGSPLAGFTAGECEPLTADGLTWRPRWKSGAALPTDRPVRVVLEMSNAQLFSLSAEA